MKIADIIGEATPTKSYCKKTKKANMSASWLASCKSQGLVSRDGNKSHKLGRKASSRVKVGGKKIKGERYKGPLPDWS